VNVFDFRNRLIDEYSTYVQSFIQIQDPLIRDFVRQRMQEGAFWPQPLLQLNPSFEPGKLIDEFVEARVLHEKCSVIFRKDKDVPAHQPLGKPFRLHKHQEEAILCARKGSNYVLTTGTGSGKSLAYIIPIVDHVLRRGAGQGIQAIVIYPMNALANSQWKELEKFLCFGFPDKKGPVTFAKYTGQEKSEERDAILANPPDILLTNYVMLELILTRPEERRLVQAAKGVQFLVLDELHTYRGRQGADVSLLVRRVRNATEAESLQCVGTSATLAGGGTFEEQQREVAKVATTLFGAEVKPESVIGETLRRLTEPDNPDSAAYLESLRNRIADPAAKPPEDFQGFVSDPLSRWIESEFGLKEDLSSRRLLRREPRSIVGEHGAASDLSKLTGVPVERCIEVIQAALLGGYHCEPNPDTGFPPFAFRLHQFIGKGDTVYASLESPTLRHITLNLQKTVPGNAEKALYPLAFCRECGQEYYSVQSFTNPAGVLQFLPRDPNDLATEEDRRPGYLYQSDANPWPVDMEGIVQRLPLDWLDETPSGFKVKSARRKYLPHPIRIGVDGTEESAGLFFHHFQAPFRFCLNCGVSYSFAQKKDFGRLGTLSSEGRSTATTILSNTAIRGLKKETTLKKEARKLLSFTDNRQDASLQAGHFNDFVEIGVLRSALAKAAREAGPEGIGHDRVVERVFKALNLPFGIYAVDPNLQFGPRKKTEIALQRVIGYRLYRDQKRGWRITSPNLEQCGLLEIRYDSLDEVSRATDLWQDTHPVLVGASPEVRYDLCKTLLDFMRRELAIDVESLDQQEQESIKRESNQLLLAPWGIDEQEKLEYAPVVFPRSIRPRDYQGNVFISSYSGYGRYLKRILGGGLPRGDVDTIIRQILQVLSGPAGLVAKTLEPRDADEVPGYQLKASGMIWIAGEGDKAFRDPIRVPNQSAIGGKTNPYFVDFYRNRASEMVGLEAHEHTAQVSYVERVDRELRFGKAELPVLFCSPTMELGIDIKELNVVNMRNVPPTPANYAQRSGRAGRSGQPALVYTYCTSGSPHDQFFFRRPESMVSGAVSPPRTDLANEDLIRAHIHAIWLAETGLSLGRSLKDLLNLTGDPLDTGLKDSVRADIENQIARKRAQERAKKVLSTIESELSASDWYSDKWLDAVLLQVSKAFDQACSRWRGLYLAAIKQIKTQTEIVMDVTRSQEDKEQAKRLRREAEAQLELLAEVRDVEQSDFYSYRYFASEGFLPGYNFPRLPLSAFIPGRRIKQQSKDQYVSRPRFLAITEFGPRAFVYHEGSKYQINRVILPVGDEDVLTRKAKRCDQCGYLHPLFGNDTKDICDQCGIELGGTMDNLFHLQNVVTKRRERINSDEEERMRMGYEIITAVRFTEHGMRPSKREAGVEGGDGQIARLTYGPAATIWRVNVGWTRRRDRSQFGFVLDVERGYWSKNEQTDENDEADPMSARTRRVIPYVEDHKNCLIFRSSSPVDDETMASLQAALKSAIQVRFQLEDNELAVEPLPDRDDRKMILFYESAEGGAGVLRRLLDEPDALRQVAREALTLCHFDPDTGEDVRRPPRGREDCETACYDCLMSYYNQRDHYLLNRHKIKEFLLALANAEVKVSPASLPRQEHLDLLKRRCESGLERRFLDFLESKNLRLPTYAQKRIEECGTKPDFLYADGGNLAAVYVDGPPHDFPDRQKRDEEITERMEDRGYLVIRCKHYEEWGPKIATYPSVFGSTS
jgi:ATP-dependent helicase YprA (DUF1998 family)